MLRALRSEFALAIFTSILFGFLFWLIDGCFEYKFFHENLSFMLLEGPETLWESLIYKIPLHSIFVRVSFLVACFIGGLLMAFFIYKRRRIDAALLESEEKFRSLVETMSDGLWIQDLNGQVNYANHKFLEMIGYSLDRVMGRSVSEFLEEPNRSIFDRQMLNARNGEAKSREIVWKGKDGREIPTITSPQPIYDQEGEFIGSFSVITDITDQKAAEKERQAYEVKLRSLASELLFSEERERRRIASGLHDSVAQDLSMSKFKVDALRSTSSAAPHLETLREISGLVSQATHQIRSLVFDISPPQLYELGLGAALESLLEKIGEQHGLKTEFMDDDLPKPMSEDICILLFRAVQELLLNTIEHARAARIGLSLIRKDENIRITVEDDGQGFDYKKEDFSSGGTRGFGLFSIRERLNYLGGSFEIDSSPGNGTRAILMPPLN